MCLSLGVRAPQRLPQALRWASPDLQGDREIVSIAVAENGEALRWVSAKLVEGNRNRNMNSRALRIGHPHPADLQPLKRQAMYAPLRTFEGSE